MGDELTCLDVVEQHNGDFNRNGFAPCLQALCCEETEGAIADVSAPLSPLSFSCPILLGANHPLHRGVWIRMNRFKMSGVSW